MALDGVVHPRLVSFLPLRAYSNSCLPVCQAGTLVQCLPFPCLLENIIHAVAVWLLFCSCKGSTTSHTCYPNCFSMFLFTERDCLYKSPLTLEDASKCHMSSNLSQQLLGFVQCGVDLCSSLVNKMKKIYTSGSSRRQIKSKDRGFVSSNIRHNLPLSILQDYHLCRARRMVCHASKLFSVNL